jgi:pyrimidine-nucleoside phosphorylase
MIRIGRNMGRTMCAVISDMNSPLGHMVGNALEVNEAVKTLRGGGPEDLKSFA